LVGFVAIDVSLCGPSSLLTSTFAPTLMLPDEVPRAGVKPGAETTSYFCHHVGFALWIVVSLPADAPPEAASTASAASAGSTQVLRFIQWLLLS
jgi:hypothetical protein